MKNFDKLIFSMMMLSSFILLRSQSMPARFAQKVWNASWIKVPKTDGSQYGVYLFRKQLNIDKMVDKFPVYVSADNSYQLYVNDVLVSRGPAKGDVFHWHFEQLDLAPYIKKGINTFAAKVFNGGGLKPESQKSFTSGFILQGTTEYTSLINTDTSWKCIQDMSYAPILISDYMPQEGMLLLPGYYVAGHGEKVQMEKQVLNWEKQHFNDDNWQNAQIISPGIPQDIVGFDAGNSWRLIPSDLPQMKSVPQRFESLRNVSDTSISKKFPKNRTTIEVPRNSTVTLLLDQSYITNAYPVINFSGGKDSSINLTYAESLYQTEKEKGNRNEISGKKIIGRTDNILPSGAKDQSYSPLTYRTYRYVEVKIITASDPLIIEDISSMATGYPFELKAKLNTANAEIIKMFEIGWRTAQLCSMDTYMDCPYWEQLQYIGDTRIQSMISLYNSGDDRLLKNAIEQFSYSRQAEGITASRYPSNNVQIITPFSLWYIGMLKDYMMYGEDQDFVKSKVSGTRQIFEYFQRFQDADGSLKNLPYWSFTDWVNQWERGVPPIGKDGSSALLDLQLLLAYQDAKVLETYLGMSGYVSVYDQKINQLSKIIKEKYWDEKKRLFADTIDKDVFSQHTNSLAILAGLIEGEISNDVARKIISDRSMTKASIYFKYYVHQALTKAGQGNDYMSWLGDWRKNIELGLTTWGEDSNVESTRSDCHAWGASPNIEFFRTILGIESSLPGFKKVKIEPHLGDIRLISGEMPHPSGKISVKYKVSKKMTATIVLPEGISGVFIWKGKEFQIKSGENAIKF